MIVRTWSGRVKLDQADGFHEHVRRTGIDDFREQPGCIALELWRRDEGDWAIFTLVSTWRDMASIAAHAGPDPTRAILFPGDEIYGLVPDLDVVHHRLLDTVTV